MNKDNQSNADERIRKLDEQYAEIQVELARLSKENAELLNVMNKLIDKVAKLQKENAEQYKKTELRSSETADELTDSEMIDELTEREIHEKEIAKILEENRKMIRETTDITEVMARPSIGRILEKRFDSDYLGPLKLEYHRDVGSLEVDAWGTCRSSTGAAYIVEIDIEFCDIHIESVLRQVELFRYYMTDYEERAVYPMLAMMEISEEDRRKVWNAGIHLIDIDDSNFCTYAKPPEDFEANGYHGAHGVKRGVPHLQLVNGVDQKKQRGTE